MFPTRDAARPETLFILSWIDLNARKFRIDHSVQGGNGLHRKSDVSIWNIPTGQNQAGLARF
jgi:hypothetical protein